MKFHPSPELLLRYAAGSMSPAMSFVVATHIHHCEICRAQQASIEGFGGDSIESYEDAKFNENSFDALWHRIGHSASEMNGYNSDLSVALATDYQSVLKQLVDRDYTGINWQSVAKKIQRAEVSIDDSENQIELLKFEGAAKIPQHTHKGNEYTVILQGSYKDEMGRFEVGDFIHLNENHHHRPIADEDGCVCIAVTDAPMHFTGISAKNA